MYDPTIFDNLKVVTEGALYDAEREGNIRIVARQDMMDLAAMGRTFRMEFATPAIEQSKCSIELSSLLPDFAAELAKLRLVEDVQPGCQLLIRYRFFRVQLEKEELADVENILKQCWSDEIRISHDTSVTHVRQDQQYTSESTYTVNIHFPRKIDEDQIMQLEEMLSNAVSSFKRLQQSIQK